MDDPVFDPWGKDAEGADAVPSPTRWRSRAVKGPVARPHSAVPGTAAQDSPSPALRTPEAGAADHDYAAGRGKRLSGTAVLLRQTALPRLVEIARRLQMARHEVSIEDLLDQSPPLLRLWMRPWRGPLCDDPTPPLARLELILTSGEGELVVARTWLDDGLDNPTREVGIPAAGLGGDPLIRVTADFVERVLSAL